MTMLVLPLSGGGGAGVDIYETIGELPGGQPDGTIASVIEDQSIRQYDATTNTWVIVGKAGVLYDVADTDSIDMSAVNGVVSAALKLSSDGAEADFKPVAFVIETDGLRGQIADEDIQDAAFSIIFSTDSISLTYDDAAGEFSADLNISGTGPDTGFIDVELQIESDGLRGQVAIPDIHDLFSAGDTNSVNMSYDGTGEFSADLNLSADGASANNQLVSLSIKADGLHAEIPDSAIQGAITILDTDSIDMSYMGGQLFASLKISNDYAGPTYLQVQFAIAADGLLAGVAVNDVFSKFSATAPLTFNAGTFAMPAASNLQSGYLSDTDWSMFNAKQEAISVGSLGAGNANGLSLSSGSLVLHAATSTQPGAVSISAQSFDGDKTFNGSIVKQNNQTNTTFVSSVTASAAGASASNLQTATATFDSDSIMFLVEVGTERQSILVHASYASSAITILSDLGSLALQSDAGAGIYISKPTSSAVISIKNRMGGTRVIRVRAISSAITSATAWA